MIHYKHHETFHGSIRTWSRSICVRDYTVDACDVHLNGVEVNQLHASYKLPYRDKEPLLAAIRESVLRVLLYDRNTETGRVSRVNARLLNTFTRKETSQDHISALQNEQTRWRYSETWQKLICYWKGV